MHVAGALHADATTPAPVWLTRPEDVNALTAKLWSETVTRDDDGVICVGGIRLTDLAEQVGTPAYVIDEVDFRSRALDWREAFTGWTVYYAGKSFLCGTVVRWAAEEGLNLDVCSLGELTVALRAGFDPARIGMHGNNKSEAELRLALERGVGRIIVDSSDEITRLENLCAELDTTARVMIRVTTGVEAHTHEYIATAHGCSSSSSTPTSAARSSTPPASKWLRGAPSSCSHNSRRRPASSWRSWTSAAASASRTPRRTPRQRRSSWPVASATSSSTNAGASASTRRRSRSSRAARSWVLRGLPSTASAR
jgi:hypothetical protein